MERRRRVMRSLFLLVAVAVLGYVLGAMAWLDLVPWSR
jgi:amino acid transporter